ncbi:sugar transferase [Aerococcaceae bacterium DSM 111020]|nr:sugar transferase [Aerococcaceae bacterium DSM 111020]
MQSFYRNYGKRLCDIVLSGLAMIVLAPVLIILGVLIFVKLGHPIIFTQRRPGLNGEIFTLKKFRTMTDKRGADGELLPDAERLTPFGAFLRSTSLDELPELWNIFVGDMSIVGPRPLLVAYLALYNDRQHKRHDVRPGLTGYAQVNGRNTLDWSERFELDVWYVEHLSFWLDVKIIFQTVFKVLKREDINSDSSATMEPFRGNTYEEE